ncbi:carbohydrate ABC transporter substrate-binding protein, partial [bacterium M00.F.Ca.ET.168.01.1.1]
GVAIPKTSPDVGKAKALVAYMLKPETQIATLKATNFFPVVDVKLPDDVPASVKAFAPVIAAMTGAPDALPALPPMGLGDLGGKFNQVYSDSFERIVLGGEDVHG